MYSENNSLLGFNTSMLTYKSINAMDVLGEYFLSKLNSNIVSKLLSLYKWRDGVKRDKPYVRSHGYLVFTYSSIQINFLRHV